MANFSSNCGKLKEGDEEVVGNCHLDEKKEVQEDASRRLISSDVTAPRHWNQDSSENAFGEELAFGRNVKFEGDIENAREKDGATKIRSNRLSEDVGESNKVCCLAGGQEGILLAKEEEESEENGFKLTNFVFTKPPWLSGEAVGSRRRRRRDFVDDNGTRIKEHDFVGSASGSFGKSTTVGETEERSQEELEYDSDGDLIVKRRKKSPQSSSKNLTIQIQHKTQTTLSDVGFQVWKGALFLADYLLGNPGLLRDKTVLEIGSGTGLTAIAAKLCRPRRILATDLEPNLSLIRTNEAKNLDIATEAPAVELITLPLDVLDASPLKSIDEVFLDDVDVVLCADMIYDDDITKGLMETLRELLERRVRRHLKGGEEKKGAIRNDRDTASTALMTILFSIEKRFNFTLEAMDVTATAYEAFKRELSVTKELFFSHFNSDFPLSGSDKILETNCVGMYFAESRQDLKWTQRELSAEEVDRAFIYNASKHLVLIEVKVTVERGELLS